MENVIFHKLTSNSYSISNVVHYIIFYFKFSYQNEQLIVYCFELFCIHLIELRFTTVVDNC